MYVFDYLDRAAGNPTKRELVPEINAIVGIDILSRDGGDEAIEAKADAAADALAIACGRLQNRLQLRALLASGLLGLAVWPLGWLSSVAAAAGALLITHVIVKTSDIDRALLAGVLSIQHVGSDRA